MAKRRHQEEEQERQHLYLVFDDDPFGYSIRKISLSPSTSRQTRSSRKTKNASASGECGAVRRLPYPIIWLESWRGLPRNVAAVGTRIAMTQCLNPSSDGDYVFPIYDVRSRAVTFGPGNYWDGNPIHIPIGDDELFAVDTGCLRKLSFESRRPQPRDSCERRCRDNDDPWSWQQLPPAPFSVYDVSSYTVHPDGQTILVGTALLPGHP